MVKIEAVVRPFRLEAIQDALLAVGIQRMTVAEVSGFGHQQVSTELYRGTEYQAGCTLKLFITLVVADNEADAVLDAIRKAAYTGKIGDGKVFISRIDEAIRIRTRETGTYAL